MTGSEHQIDNFKDRVNSSAKIGRGRQLVRNTSVRDFLFGPGNARGHCCVRHQKQTREVIRRESAGHAKGERDLRFHRECRMAPGEDEAEPIIRNADLHLLEIILAS